MVTRELTSWDTLRDTVEKIRKAAGNKPVTGGKNEVLFRGQPYEFLKTSLERWTDRKLSVQQYMMYANHCSDELESLTGKKWDIPSGPELDEEIRANQDSSRVYLPCYDYLVYLRHHGFPSPLLDWTASPYIAAYFAFAEKPSSERVAVYAYIESLKGSKGKVGDAPQISVQGPFVSTHSRHFAQKAQYTVATKYDRESGEHFFCNHADVFQATREYAGALTKGQDILIKITLPASDRIKALRELDNDCNINHFTLFQTEDALVKALAIRGFDLEIG